MNISSNIIIGLQYAKFCNFYNNLRTYTLELNNVYPNTNDELLIALCIHIIKVNNKELLEHVYFTSNKNGIRKYTYTINKENDNPLWVDCDYDLELNDIKEYISLQPNIHNLDYFYKNV
jgi:hypothetical protein